MIWVMKYEKTCREGSVMGTHLDNAEGNVSEN